jgi:hypothetical protein
MAKIDKVLGSISPLYGAVSGQGLFGKGMVALGDALGPAAGLMPMAASQLEKRRERKRAGEQKEETTAMRKGGKVKSAAAAAVHKHERNMHKGKPLTKMAKGGKVTRGDGICQKGHTKGKMV